MGLQNLASQGMVPLFAKEISEDLMLAESAALPIHQGWGHGLKFGLIMGHAACFA